MFKLDLKINQTSKISLHQQIANQVKRLIATGEIKAGERLPSVRQFAEDLNVNSNTVLKAYLILEQDNIVSAHRHYGTVVIASRYDPGFVVERQQKLLELIDDHIIHVLSLGYNPEDIEMAYCASLNRWREVRKHKMK